MVIFSLVRGIIMTLVLVVGTILSQIYLDQKAGLSLGLR